MGVAAGLDTLSPFAITQKRLDGRRFMIETLAEADSETADRLEPKLARKWTFNQAGKTLIVDLLPHVNFTTARS